MVILHIYLFIYFIFVLVSCCGFIFFYIIHTVFGLMCIKKECEREMGEERERKRNEESEREWE